MNSARQFSRQPCLAGSPAISVGYEVRLVAALWFFLAPVRVGAAVPSIRYVVDLRDPPSHKASITMSIPEAPGGLAIQFPAWNALYQIRDFVRNVENLTASCDGQADSLARVDLETWQSASRSCSALEVRYTVYLNQEGIFSSVLNPEHAYLNLAMLLFYLPAERSRAAQIELLLPQGWEAETLISKDKSGEAFSASNYDALVDSPVEAAPAPGSDREGKLHIFQYEQNGVAYRAVVFAAPADYSPDRLMTSLQKITATEVALMGGAPFAHYTFIIEIPHGPGGGGMEHALGAAISVPAAGLRNNWARFEGIAAHEFFHAWNVKRIRPQGLEPVDYIHGNDTRDLWFSEGVTSTYGDLTLLRAGLISRRDFYRMVSRQVQELQRRPARLSQSAEQSGREAWLEKYSDYFRPERSISYYNKGEILGFMLDLGIRHATGNRRSLDDVMRQLNQDFAERGRFFTDADLKSIISHVAPAFEKLDDFFREDVWGVAELDYSTYFGFAGLRLSTAPGEAAAPGFTPAPLPNGGLEVQSVEAGSSAGKGGLKNGDIILQINGEPVAGRFQARLAGLTPGQKMELKVQRGRRHKTIKFILGSSPTQAYHLEEISGATPEQLSVRAGWLEGKTAGP